MDIDELTKQVIGCAYDVGNQMGYGFVESVYEKCLLVELARKGIKAQAQKRIRVFYKEAEVGEFIADIVVDDRLILEIKKASTLTQIHEAQLINYLQATGMENGLLINFAEDKVEIKRKFRQAKKLPPSQKTSCQS